MLKWIGYLLIAALAIAFFTVPSQTKFEKFVAEKMDVSKCKPRIVHQQFKVIFPLFTLSYASECKGLKTLQGLQTSDPANNNVAIPEYEKEQKFLGLFGRFWKL